MRKYSQYDEQEHILKAFAGPLPGDILMGSFLDIGAYNPTELSNTRALYELGWRGVMIEPSPGPMSSLIREYGKSERITLIQALVVVSSIYSLIPFRVTDDAVSTADDGYYNTWKDHANYLGSILVPSVSLQAIGNAFDPFDFINFDAEGGSAELFIDGIRNLGWRPRCVCVEHDGRAMELSEIAQFCGYRLVYDNETNMVFVRRS